MLGETHEKVSVGVSFVNDGGNEKYVTNGQHPIDAHRSPHDHIPVKTAFGMGETVRSFIREPLFIWMDALAQASDESVSISVPVMRPVLLVVIILPSLAWSIGFLARRLYGTMPDEPMRCRFFRGLWSEDGFFGVSQNDFGTATIAIIEIWSCRMPVDNCWYD